jgi:hypothetical protein
MRYITSIFLTAVAALLLHSCTKVIDVKINDTAKKYVIAGKITDQPGGCEVSISQTKNFNEDNTFAGISGASVSITDNSTGTVTSLSESAPGTYTNATLSGMSGKAYTLQVLVGGQTFTAISAMPQKVNLDTLYITKDNLFGNINYLANVTITDPPGKGNNYSLKEYVNGKKMKQILVTNDDYFDGKKLESKLFPDQTTSDEDKVKPGDTIRMDMMCIDANVYKYWFSLQQSATGANQSAAPANPVTNMQGGALGYFSAQTMQVKTAIVQ